MSAADCWGVRSSVGNLSEMTFGYLSSSLTIFNLSPPGMLEMNRSSFLWSALGGIVLVSSLCTSCFILVWGAGKQIELVCSSLTFFWWSLDFGVYTGANSRIHELYGFEIIQLQFLVNHRSREFFRFPLKVCSCHLCKYLSNETKIIF